MFWIISKHIKSTIKWSRCFFTILVGPWNPIYFYLYRNKISPFLRIVWFRYRSTEHPLDHFIVHILSDCKFITGLVLTTTQRLYKQSPVVCWAITIIYWSLCCSSCHRCSCISVWWRRCTLNFPFFICHHCVWCHKRFPWACFFGDHIQTDQTNV